MLALLSRGATRLLDGVGLETAELSPHSPQVEETFSIDVNALSTLFPSTEFAWRRLAGLCGQTIRPMYKSIQTLLNEDVENVTRLLYELEAEPMEEEEKEKDLKAATCGQHSSYTREPSSLDDTTLQPNGHERKQHPPLNHPVFVPSTHLSAPSIIITPCATSPRPFSCCVPLQDASYGNKLAVPGYPHLNSGFPPCILQPGHMLLVERWKWRDGHWWAVVPDLEVQRRKGWFSRPISARRRVARPCRTGSAPEEL